MKTLIIYSSSSTFRPRSVIASLATDQKALGHEPTVLDIGAYSYVTQDLPPRWFARLFGHTIFPRALQETLSRNDIPYKTLVPGNSGPHTPLPPDVQAELDDAVYSELVTYVLSDEPDYANWFTAYSARRIRASAEPLLPDLSQFLEAHDFVRILIPNGRVPDQRLALLAAQSQSLEIGFYEIGRALENSYYTGTQQVHDRDGTQAEVGEKTRHLSDTEITQIATDWIKTRTGTGLAIHPYNSRWVEMETDSSSRSSASEPLAVFFSSSVDEFASYGGSWASHEWDDQYEAFEAIIGLLKGQGVRCVLRLHPNLVNKNRHYVDREISRVKLLKQRLPATEILSHTDTTNSYALLKAADYVIVGRSTLGLEASCLGKCVWTTTAARYDDIADVRRILAAKDVTARNLSPWQVNPLGAQRFVSYWVIQDHPFSYGENEWATWDSLRTPLSMKIGSLWVKNSLAHKLHLIRLEFVRARNRRVGIRLGRALRG